MNHSSDNIGKMSSLDAPIKLVWNMYIDSIKIGKFYSLEKSTKKFEKNLWIL